MKAVLIGFPKSGTSTIQRALRRSGFVSIHWKHHDRPIGQMIYEGLFRHGDPFALFPGIDAITQMNYCVPNAPDGGSFWRNLDFSVLFAIRRRHPGCRLILNYREPRATARSMLRWRNLTSRYAACDIPGLPRGYGTEEDDLVAWIEASHHAQRAAFAGYPAFVEIDIAHPDAADHLGAALGTRIRWWGVANANPPGTGPSGEEDRLVRA